MPIFWLGYQGIAFSCMITIYASSGQYFWQSSGTCSQFVISGWITRLLSCPFLLSHTVARIFTHSTSRCICVCVCVCACASMSDTKAHICALYIKMIRHRNFVECMQLALLAIHKVVVLALIFSTYCVHNIMVECSLLCQHFMHLLGRLAGAKMTTLSAMY